VEGLKWNKEIVEMSQRLSAFSPAEDTTMAQLQRAVIGLVSQWQHTRETIAGGATQQPLFTDQLLIALLLRHLKLDVINFLLNLLNLFCGGKIEPQRSV